MGARFDGPVHEDSAEGGPGVLRCWWFGRRPEFCCVLKLLFTGFASIPHTRLNPVGAACPVAGLSGRRRFGCFCPPVGRHQGERNARLCSASLDTPIWWRLGRGVDADGATPTTFSEVIGDIWHLSAQLLSADFHMRDVFHNRLHTQWWNARNGR